MSKKYKNETNLAPADTESKATKRGLIKALGASAGVLAATNILPEKWVKPVVNSIMLPAHAQVTPSTDPCPEFEFQQCEITVGGTVYSTTMSTETFMHMTAGMADMFSMANATIGSVSGANPAMVQLTVVLSGSSIDGMTMGMDMTNMMGVANMFGIAPYAAMMGDTVTVVYSIEDPQCNPDECELIIELQ